MLTTTYNKGKLTDQQKDGDSSSTETTVTYLVG